jgi:multidrug efflux pump subunit AcrB
VQVRGKDAASTAQIAETLQEQIKDVPGAVDVFMQQEVNAPKLNINVDRLKAQELALTAKDVSDDVLLSLSGSGQVAPNFWLDPKTGIEYPVIVQVPQYRLHNLDTLEQTAVRSSMPGLSDQLLRNVSETERQVSPLTVSHRNALPVMDVFANVQQRDLGGVASDVQKIVEKNSHHLPPGTEVVLSGQVLTMNTSFANLEIGIAAAVVFVYLLMAMNFQSWTIPFVILMALPGPSLGLYGCCSSRRRRSTCHP